MSLLTGPMAAERAGITYNAWKLAKRTKQGRPAPDHRLAWGDFWEPSTIDAWRAQRHPTHAEIINNRKTGRPQRASRQTVRRHLFRHDTRTCSCYVATKGLRI